MTEKQTLQRFVLEMTGTRPVLYNPAIARHTSIEAAILLSQFLYWQQVKGPEEWFYKTEHEIEQETALSRHESLTARQQLVKLGIIEQNRRGVPPINHFRVNLEKLQDVLGCGNQLSAKRTIDYPPSGQLNNREADNYLYCKSTSESTSESTSLPLASRRQETDPRFTATRNHIEELSRKHGVFFTWQVSEAKQLKEWLKATPDCPLERIKTLIENRFQSQDAPIGDRPRLWIPRLGSYTTILNCYGRAHGAREETVSEYNDRQVEILRKKILGDKPAEDPGKQLG